MATQEESKIVNKTIKNIDFALDNWISNNKVVQIITFLFSIFLNSSADNFVWLLLTKNIQILSMESDRKSLKESSISFGEMSQLIWKQPSTCLFCLFLACFKREPFSFIFMHKKSLIFSGLLWKAQPQLQSEYIRNETGECFTLCSGNVRTSYSSEIFN